MKKVILGFFVLLSLLGCSEYSGIRFISSRRKNITLFTEFGSNPKIIKNNIWSISKFLQDKIPGQNSSYEVYVTRRELKELILDEEFSKHIFDRIAENPQYSGAQRDTAAALIERDLNMIADDSPLYNLDSFYFLPAANIIMIRDYPGYDKDFFLYSYITLALLENNPGYYFNEGRTEDEMADQLMLRYLTTGLNSLYSRYFSKYHNRNQSRDLFLLLLKNDMAYLEDIYQIDLPGYKGLSNYQLVNVDTSVHYYAWFFQYVFERQTEEEFREFLASFFTPDLDKRAKLRNYFYMWKNATDS